MFEQWFEYYKGATAHIPQASTRQSQLIEVRRALMKEADAGCLPNAILHQSISEEERIWLLEEFYRNVPPEQRPALAMSVLASADASCRCLRMIGGFLRDTTRDDWFTFYVDVYSSFVRDLCRAKISERKGTFDVLPPMLQLAQQVTEQAKQMAIEGRNVNHKPGQLEEGASRESSSS